MIIIFNGPPSSGKDEAAFYFKKRGFEHLSFKSVLFRETAREFDVSYNWFMKDYDNRAVKEKPEKRLRGMSRREAMIYTSEKVIKPRYGKDFFGTQVANEILDGTDYCISDGGFIEELLPIINKIGTENITLVQLTRNNCDYSTDSRRYFDGNLIKEFVLNHQTPIKKQYVLPHKFAIKTYRVHNNSTKKDFHGVLEKIYQLEKATHETKEKGKAS